jgi:hypothetical protein
MSAHAEMIDAPLFAVVMANAVDRDGRPCEAFIGGRGTDGFNTSNAAEACALKEFTAREYASHMRGWYRGFAGGVTIEVRPHASCTPAQAESVRARAAYLASIGIAL